MNKDYEFWVEIYTWGNICQSRLDYENLTDDQIHEIAIERDLAFTIAWDLISEIITGRTHWHIN